MIRKCLDCLLGSEGFLDIKPKEGNDVNSSEEAQRWIALAIAVAFTHAWLYGPIVE